MDKSEAVLQRHLSSVAGWTWLRLMIFVGRKRRAAATPAEEAEGVGRVRRLGECDVRIHALALSPNYPRKHARLPPKGYCGICQKAGSLEVVRQLHTKSTSRDAAVTRPRGKQVRPLNGERAAALKTAAESLNKGYAVSGLMYQIDGRPVVAWADLAI